MLIYGYHIIFKNEESLNFEVANNSKETLTIEENAIFNLNDLLLLNSKWVESTGQQIKYYVSKSKSSCFAMEIKDILTLVWHESTHSITYIKEKNYTPKRLEFWLLNTFLPFLFELKKKYNILHASSVEIARKPVLFLADSYGGKSVLADYFLKQGHGMFSDDTLAIKKRDDEYYAVASYPFCKPYRKVENLGDSVENFITVSKPIHVVYVLKKGHKNCEVSIVKMQGIEKFKAFHFSSFLALDNQKKERFEFFSKMSKYLKVYSITIPWDLKRLNEVYDATVTHSQSILVQ